MCFERLVLYKCQVTRRIGRPQKLHPKQAMEASLRLGILVSWHSGGGPIQYKDHKCLALQGMEGTVRQSVLLELRALSEIPTARSLRTLRKPGSSWDAGYYRTAVGAPSEHGLQLSRGLPQSFIKCIPARLDFYFFAIVPEGSNISNRLTSHGPIHRLLSLSPGCLPLS